MVATAERKKDALFVLLGGLLGAMTFDLLYPSIKPFLIEPLNFSEVRVHQLLGVSPVLIDFVLAALLLALAWLLTDQIGESKEKTVSRPETKAA